MKPDSEEHKLL